MLETICSNCNDEIESGRDIYCSKCWDKVQEEIEKLKTEIEHLERTIDMAINLQKKEVK